MMKPEGPRNIQDRTRAYALQSVRLFQELKGTEEGRIIGRQFLRAATSIGANVAEAQAGESRKDFIHKLQIAQKEARESLYWLRLLTDAALSASGRVPDLLRETDEITAILTAIIRSAKRNAATSSTGGA